MRSPACWWGPWLLLVGYAAFAHTRAYAWTRAQEEALTTEANPWDFPLVRIYSTVDLALDEDLGVPERRLNGDDGDFRYRYDGLRLFLQHGGHVLLWPKHQSPRSGMFILDESDRWRFEYVPELR